MSNKILSWYFSDDTRRLRFGDDREIALGVEHTVKGYPEPCKHGLHGSESILDALLFAPGPILWRVELSGRIKRGDDKIAATRRRYVSGGIDVSDTLRRFACDQALSVARLWDMPAIVREYLETTDESKRAAAEDAAYAAAGDAAYAAAWDAAGAAAWGAARAAAGAAAWGAARAAASAAAWGAAGDAAYAAAGDAAYAAAGDAAYAAACGAARAAAEKRLLDLLKERHGIE